VPIDRKIERELSDSERRPAVVPNQLVVSRSATYSGLRTRWEARLSAVRLKVIGLLMNLLGTVLLLRYGMPFRVRTDGSQVRWLKEVKNEKIMRAERVHSVLGWIGLTLIVLGTASQVWGTLKGA
jgi:hypothetical protein